MMIGAVKVWLVFLSCWLANTAGAVDFPLRWRWANPAPHGGNVVDMAYSPDLSLAVQVAERGQIYTSDDLSLWLPRDSPTTAALRSVTFFARRILITGESGTVLYADDVAHFQAGSLLDGPTSSWLEAVAASSRVAVAAGDNGYVCTSSDGVAWKKQVSGTSTWLRGAAYGATNFVIVGESGAVLTSPNGTNWTIRSSPTSMHLNRVGYASGRFTAVGDGGTTIASTNGGVSWYFEYPGATNTLQYAAAGGADRLLDGSHEVRLQDGLVWSDELAKTNGPPDWTYYTAFGESDYFLIAGQTGMQSEGYQVGGLPYFWVTPYDSVRNWLWDVIHLPAFYVAAGDFGTILTSGNGVDWTLELVPRQVTNTTFLGVGGTTNLLLAVGDGGTMIYSPNLLTNVVITNGSQVVTQTVSSLGVLWLPMPSKPTTSDLQAVGALSNSLYIVGGGGGVLLTSPTGTNWTQRVSGTTNLLTSIAEWPGGLIAVGDNGTLLTSRNGVQWSTVPMNTTNWLYRVRWLNQTLITVGQKGTIRTSTDGVTWSNRVSGTTAWLNDAAFVRDTWFVVGISGTVLTSSNLVNWTSRGTITRKALYAAATDNSQLVTVGVEGVILRSQVVPDLTPVSFLEYARLTAGSPPMTYNLFLIGGKPDQRFTLNRTTNLVDSAWITGPTLEIFDGSGTLYYLETLSSTNLPSLECYRTELEP